MGLEEIVMRAGGPKWFFLKYCIIPLLLLIILIPTVNAVTPPVESSSNLVLYLPLDEGSGTAVSDQSGNGNDGTISNCTWVEGRYGYGLHFSKDGGTITIPTSDSLNVSYFTISFWIYVNPRDYSSVFEISKYKNPNGYEVWLVWYADQDYVSPHIRVDDDSGYWCSEGDVPFNEWVWVVITYHHPYAKLYINGRYIDCDAYVDSYEANPNDADLVISGYDVIVDEIRIWNTDLTAEQIRLMYEALRLEVYDEQDLDKIQANITVFNLNYTLTLEYDEVTQSYLIFHKNVTSYGIYQVKAEATNYSVRFILVNLEEYKRVERAIYLPLLENSVLIKFNLEDNTNKYKDNGILILKKTINNNPTIVFENYFDVGLSCQVYLLADEIYYVYVTNGVETEYLGTYSSAVSTVVTLKIGEPVSQIVQSAITLPVHPVVIKVMKGLTPYVNVPVAIKDQYNNSYVLYTDDEGKIVAWMNKTVMYEIDVNYSEKVVKLYPFESKYSIIIPLDVTVEEVNVTYNVTEGEWPFGLKGIAANLTSQLSPTARGIICALVVWLAMFGSARVFTNVSFIGLIVLIMLAILGFADFLMVLFAGLFVVGMYVLKRWL